MLARGSNPKACARPSPSTIAPFCSTDQVAADFMEKHGHASYEVIAADLRQPVSCPKLRSYWHFQNCRYNKTRYTCAEPDHLPRCPLPRQWLRNGRLNQTAYSLYLFIRDVAGGDLVG